MGRQRSALRPAASAARVSRASVVRRHTQTQSTERPTRAIRRCRKWIVRKRKRPDGMPRSARCYFLLPLRGHYHESGIRLKSPLYSLGAESDALALPPLPPAPLLLLVLLVLLPSSHPVLCTPDHIILADQGPSVSTRPGMGLAFDCGRRAPAASFRRRRLLRYSFPCSAGASKWGDSTRCDCSNWIAT